jgi:hypothetical protein
VYDVHANRQGIAITWGNLNKILYNRVSDTIDLELDTTVGECKGNLVYGNTGRTVSNGETTILTSDLRISLASLGTAFARYSVGNVVAANYCWAIDCQYNSGVHIVHNTVVGSNSTQQRLLSLDALYNAVVSGNVLIANAPVATALQHIIRTRAGQGLVVTDNLVNNGTIPFHNFISTFAAEPAAASHLFRGNVCTGTGDYRNGSSTSMATQTSTYKLIVAGGAPQVFTATLIDGPSIPLTFASGGGLGHVLNVTLAFASGAGLWRLEVLPYGTVGKTTEPWDRTFVHTVDEIGGTRAIEVYAAPLGGAAPVWAQVDFNSGGSIAVLFLRFHY